MPGPKEPCPMCEVRTPEVDPWLLEITLGKHRLNLSEIEADQFYEEGRAELSKYASHHNFAADYHRIHEEEHLADVARWNDAYRRVLFELSTDVKKIQMQGLGSTDELVEKGLSASEAEALVTQIREQVMADYGTYDPQMMDAIHLALALEHHGRRLSSRLRTWRLCKGFGVEERQLKTVQWHLPEAIRRLCVPAFQEQQLPFNNQEGVTQCVN